TDLLEWTPTEDVYSPGSASWSKTAASDVLTYNVRDALDPGRVENFLAYILGTEFTSTPGVDTANPPVPWQLRRTLPMRHPRYSYLFAQRVADDRGMGYHHKDPGTQVTPPGGYPTEQRPFSRYKWRRIAVEFAQPPWNYQGDNAIVGPIQLWTQAQSPQTQTL